MNNRKNISYTLSVLGSVLLLCGQRPVLAADLVTGTLVQTIYTKFGDPAIDPATNPNWFNNVPVNYDSPDGSDIVYLPRLPGALPGSPRYEDTLLVCDGEVDEMSIYQGSNLFEMTLDGTLLSTYTTAYTYAYPNPNAYTNEPVGCTFNPLNGHLFISSDDQKMVFEINPGVDALLHTADDIRTSFSTSAYGSYDPEGIAYNPVDGALYQADGASSEVYKVLPGANGTFDGVWPTGDDTVTHFDTLSLGIQDPEGIAFEADNRLYLVGKPATKIAHIYTSGPLIRMVDISTAYAKKPAGLAVGPGSSDAAALNVYISARGVDNVSDPNENDGKVYEFSVPPLPSGNRVPGVTAGPDQTVFLPAPASINLNGAVADDILPPELVTAAWSQISGPETMIFGDPNAAVTTASSSTDGAYVLRLTANDGALSASDDVTVQVRQPFTSAFSTLYLSTAASTTVSGIYVGNEDIIAHNTRTGAWSMYFDGGDVGLGVGGINVDAFKLMEDGSILLSFDNPIMLPITGAIDPVLIDDSDIVRFIPTSLGSTTAGTFEWYFKGADVGLTTDSEDIDAIGFLPDGRMVVSTSGSFNVPDVSGQDEDLIVFTASTMGAGTAGTWSMHFDGSDAGLSDGGNGEDVNGAWVDNNGDIYLTTRGVFSVPGATGGGDDIFRCIPGSTGNTTTCSYDFTWDGGGNGLPVEVVVDGMELAP